MICEVSTGLETLEAMVISHGPIDLVGAARRNNGSACFPSEYLHFQLAFFLLFISGSEHSHYSG